MPDSGLQLHRSNRLELLAAELCAWLQATGGDPFRAPVVLVQSLGMERWLRQEISARLGVCAHIRFPFPRAFVWELQRELNPELPDQSPWEPAALTWRLYGLQPQLIARDVFLPLRHYLQDGDARKRHQLAQRLANLFDQYLLFRGDVLQQWDRGEDSASAESRWQAALWRELTRAMGGPHPAVLQQQLLDALARGGKFSGALPPVAAFGISSLPPFYLEVLNRLDASGGVRWFELQPCREYWADVKTNRERARELLHQRLGHDDEAWLNVESEAHAANPLLASMGRLGRDFLRVLLEQTEFNTASERFEAPVPGRLLSTVQADVFDNIARGVTAEFPKLALDPDDDSIRVHSCHGPLREMEVLRDQMLDWFRRDPTLQPRDVLVMMPDIATYAPLVQAVFGVAGKDEKAIPFSVADIAPSRGDRTVAAFLQVLKLPDSRLGAGEVLALLESELVRAKFNLSEPDLPLLREWVEQSGIRWGRDAQHREALGLPAFAQNSWRAGLDRLLLGVAMSEADGIFADRLACDGVGGKRALVLGRFAEFAERIFAIADTLQAPRPLREWVTALGQVMADCFAEPDHADAGVSLLRDVLRQCARQAEVSALNDAVPLEVLREALEPWLENDAVHRGFLTGRVTFGALKPMRSLPFRVICLVGMNDGAFPRNDAPLGFDLMARSPRLGDASRRADDRYLFLETLLSARERLHLSYVGQSEREAAPLPPSVVVSELLDCLDDSFALPADEKKVSGRVVVQHRLQAFHPLYFSRSDERFFSYSRENLAASAVAMHARQTRRLISVPLPEAPEEFRVLTVEQLAKFFSNPSRYFAQERLQLRLPRVEETLEEREPFDLSADGLKKYFLSQELLTARLAGSDPRAIEDRLRAQMRLPVGASGNGAFRALLQDVDEVVSRAQSHRTGAVERPEVDLSIGSFRVTGGLGEVWPAGLLQCRAAKIKAGDLLGAWVRHVIWNASVSGAGQTHVVGLSDKPAEREAWFAPVEAASKVLADLLDVYWRGLREPLPLFPKTSHAFAKQMAKSANEAKAIRAARKQWEPDSEYGKGDSVDEYHDLFFRDTEPFDEAFQQLALRVFGPLLEHQKGEE